MASISLLLNSSDSSGETLPRQSSREPRSSLDVSTDEFQSESSLNRKKNQRSNRSFSRFLNLLGLSYRSDSTTNESYLLLGPNPSSVDLAESTDSTEGSFSKSEKKFGKNGFEEKIKLEEEKGISSDSTSVSSTSLATPKASRPCTFTPDKLALIPKSKIHKSLLEDKPLVRIAVRRKSSTKSEGHAGSKLHVRSLEIGLRIKLIWAPSLTALYHSLILHTNKRRIVSVFDVSYQRYMNDLVPTSLPSEKMISKSVQVIDNNLVNLSDYSNKTLQNYSLNKKSATEDIESKITPTFNSLSTALYSLFGTSESTLIRVTRSTTDEHGGSVLLKIETAKPNDYSLIDDEDYAEEMLHSLGKEGEPPNSLFVKKILARPRYKSGMKIYVVPGIINCLIYVHERMLEKDLIKGVIDPEKLEKSIYATFPYESVIDRYHNLLRRSQEIYAHERDAHERDAHESDAHERDAHEEPLKPNVSTHDLKLPDKRIDDRMGTTERLGLGLNAKSTIASPGKEKIRVADISQRLHYRPNNRPRLGSRTGSYFKRNSMLTLPEPNSRSPPSQLLPLFLASDFQIDNLANYKRAMSGSDNNSGTYDEKMLLEFKWREESR